MSYPSDIELTPQQSADWEQMEQENAIWPWLADDSTGDCACEDNYETEDSVW